MTATSILHALFDFYQRKSSEANSELPKEGFQKQEIPFIVVLDETGNFVALEDTRTENKKSARSFSVPRGEKRSVNIAANLLWDNIGYVFGIDTKANPERALLQKQAFLGKIEESFAHSRDLGVEAVLKLLKNNEQIERIFNHPLGQELKESTGNISFRLANEQILVCQRPAVAEKLSENSLEKPNSKQVCLVTGKDDNPALLHTAIKGVYGAQSAGANIVSFNLDAFKSYGKSQGLNAPVGQNAEFAYTTALNYLLAKGSKQRLQIGDASTVFWAGSLNKMEAVFLDFFGGSLKDQIEPDGEAIRVLYSSPNTGAFSLDTDKTPFYVLGLAPNASRIAIRFWHHSTVAEMAKNIRCHFDDLEIVHSVNDPKYLTIHAILLETALLHKYENIQPNLAGDVISSVLSATPYPYTLLTGILRRIRADKRVFYTRAAVLKAVINRNCRYYNDKEKQIAVSLDKDNQNIGYRLGRLFAVLEKLQEEANPGINSTIRDRFYGSASSSPVTVFPYLLKLKNHHIAKLDSKGRGIFLEKEIGEIFQSINDFPAHMSLADQGRFAVGYYHQRQQFYTKREEN